MYLHKVLCRVLSVPARALRGAVGQAPEGRRVRRGRWLGGGGRASPGGRGQQHYSSCNSKGQKSASGGTMFGACARPTRAGKDACASRAGLIGMGLELL